MKMISVFPCAEYHPAVFSRFNPAWRYNGPLMGDWVSTLGLSREALIHPLRTAGAAVVSLLLARGLKQPQFYWVPISTIVILLSPINPMSLGWQRFVGTALGGVLGAVGD